MKQQQTGHLTSGSASPGISLVEVLVIVALMGTMALLTVPLLSQNPANIWARTTEDYMTHLAAMYNKISLERGDSPAQVRDPSGNLVYPDGMASVLADWETVATHVTGPPRRLHYPNKIVVYLHPEQASIPNPGSGMLLPIHQSGSPAEIMAGTANKDWLLLDVNGVTEPNQLGPEGDRILLLVEDATGRIITAWKKCLELDGQAGYTVSVDTDEGTCTISSPAPSRIYYKSRYDTLKNL